MTAQRLLVERGNLNVLPELYDLVKNKNVDELGYNYAATHALWIIDGLGALSKDDKAEKSLMSLNINPQVLEKQPFRFFLNPDCQKKP